MVSLQCGSNYVAAIVQGPVKPYHIQGTYSHFHQCMSSYKNAKMQDVGTFSHVNHRHQAVLKNGFTSGIGVHWHASMSLNKYDRHMAFHLNELSCELS